jgi:hypothetical protein
VSGRRIELSATQVIASMLAAVTGAIAASYTGITGTVVGVAVASVISTAGAAVYKHYLARSREKLRSAAVVIAPRVRATGLAAHRARPPSADQVATEEFPAIATGDGGGGIPAIGPAGPAGEPGGPGRGRSTRRRWLIWVAAAVAIFVVTMGVITVVEVAAGKPLDALIWGRTSHGTTVSDLTGGQRATRPKPDLTTPAPTPTVTLTVTPTPTSASPSPSPSQSSTPSPSPTTSSPSPSPSPSRSSSPS